MIPFTDYTRYDGLGLAALVKRGEVSAGGTAGGRDRAASRRSTRRSTPSSASATRRPAPRPRRSTATRPSPACPSCVKDLLATLAGEPTACGNRLLARMPMPHDSELVRR